LATIVCLTLTGEVRAQVGACCFECEMDTFVCVEVTESECMTLVGIYEGDGTLCADSTCDPTVQCPSDPPCNGVGVGLSLIARLDGANITGPVIEGDVVEYEVTLFNTAPSGCDFVVGQLSVTLPNGDVVEVAGFGGATPNIGRVMFGNPLVFPMDGDPAITYTVTNDDVVSGVVAARADYGTTVDQPAQENGIILSTPPLQEASATTAGLLVFADILITKTPSVERICDGEDTPVSYMYELTTDRGGADLEGDANGDGTIDVIPMDDTCGPLMFVGGDDDGDGELDGVDIFTGAPGETWMFVCTTNISQETTNTVTAEMDTVSGNPPQTVTAQAMATIMANPSPMCEIDGPTEVCPGQQAIMYTAMETSVPPMPGATFQWAIRGDALFCDGSNMAVGEMVCVNADDECDGGFELTVIVTVDDCTNTCTLDVDVIDDTPPTLDCPDGNTKLDCNVPFKGTVTAKDDCDRSPMIACSAVFDPPGSGNFMDNGNGFFEIVFTDNGTATVTCTATDECNNNSDECTFSFSADNCCQSRIGDFVWLDLNQDGCQDDNEDGIPGVTVMLFEGCGPGRLLATTMTDANGFYNFDLLCAGDYLVRFTTPDGLAETTPNANCGANSDENDSDCVNGEVCVNVPNNATVNLTIDCGFVCTGSIGDRVWRDDNGNGCQDPGEMGIPGVRVTLFSSCANPVEIANVDTDANGLYVFNDLCAGDYVVTFETPPGLEETTPNANCGANSDENDSDCVNGEVCVTLDEGETDLTIDCGFRCNGVIGDRVWRDDNGNGCQDEGEEGIPNIRVTLFMDCANPVEVDNVMTDGSGLYEFRGLCAGEYLIRFDTPDGLVETIPNAGCGPNSDENDSDCVNGEVCVNVPNNATV
ncbi:MAG: SdrD B-like domain-containing protein, partial [Planctomycetota bacterium]